MKGFTKFAMKFGMKPVSIAVLVVSWLAIIATFGWQSQQQQQINQQQFNNSNQQTAKVFAATVAAQINSWQQELSAMAQLPQVIQSMTDSNQALIEVTQKQLVSTLPGTLRACLIKGKVDQPQPDACLPITYATLNSLREVVDSGVAKTAVMQPGTESAHVLLAHAVMDDSKQYLGTLMIAVKPDVLSSLLIAAGAQGAYLELQQGTKQVTTLVKKGDASLRQNNPAATVPIANSHWKLAYWVKPVTTASNVVVMATLLGIITLLWLIYGFWLSVLVRADSAMLRQQLLDFNQGQLKPKYPLAFSKMHDVADEIQHMAVTYVQPKGDAKVTRKKVVPAPEQIVHEELESLPPELEATTSATDTQTVTESIEVAEEQQSNTVEIESGDADTSLDFAIDEAEQVVSEQQQVTEEEIELTEQAEEAESSVLEFISEPVQAEVVANPETLVIDLEQDDVPDGDVASAPEREKLESTTLEFVLEDENDAEPEADLLVLDAAAGEQPTANEPLSFDLDLTDDTDSSIETQSASASLATSDGDVPASIFRAYDIRGIVSEHINGDVFRRIGQAIGSTAIDAGRDAILVGRDGRTSSEGLSHALIEGIKASGCNVIDLDALPTPLVHFACEMLETDSSVMVTGSHNPKQYNGLKLRIAGETVSGDKLQALYQRIQQGQLHTGEGSVSQKAGVIEAYIDKVAANISVSRSLKVVVDCGNGIAGKVMPQLLQAMGCEVTELYCEVDGHFPNHHPDPSRVENMQDLAAAVKAYQAELGLAFDGDGDRIGVVDAKGEIIWPDRLLVLFAQDILKRHDNATIVYDVKSTDIISEVVSLAGGTAVMSASGYPVIKQKMEETGALLAGEMSGHIFFKERWTGTDDALYSACRLLELVAADPQQRTATDVFATVPQRSNTPEILLEMDDEEGRRLVARLQTEANFGNGKVITIDGVRVDYPNGWGLVRVSNTVPGLTLRFEAINEEELEQIKQTFKQQMLQLKPTLSLEF